MADLAPASGWPSLARPPKLRAASSTSKTARWAGRASSWQCQTRSGWTTAMRGDSAPSILMVDDDPHVLRSLRAALESHGYRVRSAATGPSALDACATERPDVVLLDL